MDDFEINEILEEADRTGKGQISETDFVRIMKKTDLISPYREHSKGENEE
jgi:Ca2+-binding EF-hand superfamily protein